MLIAYSEKFQSAFHKYYVVFSRTNGNQKLSTLVLDTFKNYKKTTKVCIFINKFIVNSNL